MLLPFALIGATLVHEGFVRLLMLTVAILLTGSLAFSGSSALSSLEAEGSEIAGDNLEAVGLEADFTIGVVDDAFEDPATALPVSVVSVGDKVRWFWEENNPHTVTSVSSLNNDDFDSGFRDSGDEPENGGDELFEVTFEEPDVIQYTCEVHPGMEGLLVVV